MFNYSYFKYLIKSKGYLLIFTLILSLLISLTNTGNNYLVGYSGLITICIVLCYGLPCLIFSYVHNKKAVDSYYSLDIDRKSMLITGLLFCIFTVLVIFVLNSIIIYFSEVRQPKIIHPNVSSLPYSNAAVINTPGLPVRLLIMTLAFVTLIVFNTCIYLSANTVFDGIIMLGAYTALPVAIYLLNASFVSSFVYGFNASGAIYIRYLSPVYLLVELFSTMFMNTFYSYSLGKNLLPSSILALLLFLIVSYIVLYHGYKKRKVERAGTVSNNFFSYPLIINLYALICVFIITFDSQRGGVLSFLANSALFYVMIFALYMIAHFIYLRKLSLNYRTPIVFILIVLISLLFSNIAHKTNGFGISKNYIKDDPTVVYDYYVNYWDSSYIDELDIHKWLLENMPEGIVADSEYVSNLDENYKYLTINITNINSFDPLSKETIDYFENVREEAIDNYYENIYNQKSSYYYGSNHYDIGASLRVSNNVVKYKNDNAVYDVGTYYTYRDVNSVITLEDLLKLSNDHSLEITIWYENAKLGYANSLRLIDGKLVIVR